jgi:hypothetical protein
MKNREQQSPEELKSQKRFLKYWLKNNTFIRISLLTISGFMKNIALMFLFSVLFFSCEKEKPLIVENGDIPLISKVLIGGEIYMEYSYNGANLVTEEKSKFHYTRHNYNEINQLISSDLYFDLRSVSSNSIVLEAAMNRKEWVSPANTQKSISHSLEYNIKGELVRKSFIKPSDDNNHIVEFLYENDRIVRLTRYNNNSIPGYTDYLYDNNGNIIKQMNYTVSSAGVADLTTATEYEYDNMNNPYQSFRRLLTPGVNSNPNNITKETYTIYFEVNQYTEKVQITENSYEYNDLGYPVKVNGVTEYVYK